MKKNKITTNKKVTGKSNKNTYISFDKFITAITIALANANHLEIEPLLTKRGYDPASIDTAKLMLTNLETLQEKQKVKYAEQFGATKTYSKDWGVLRTLYAEHVALARIVFNKDLHNYIQLGLKGIRKRDFSGYIQQAKLFYANAIKDQHVLDLLANKGITKKELEDTNALISQVEEKKYKQNKLAGKAQQATKERNEAYKELAKWFGNFKSTAKVAISSKPLLGVILGFK